MLQDALGSLAAVLVFAVVLYAPGYLIAYATDLFGFRQMPLAERSLWALACSFCVAPMAAYLVGRGAGLRGVCWFFAASATGALLLFLCQVFLRPVFLRRDGQCCGLGAGRAAWPPRDRRITALVVCGWTAFVLLMLIDVQVGNKLYFSVVMADQSYRIAFTDAVIRTGIPPANPLYFAGTPAPMRYYYFWYVLCATVAKLAHVSARQAFIASSVWAGFGLMATVKLYTTHFFRWQRKRQWIALGLLLVSGADLVPALGQAILQPSLNGDTEWWSVDPIDAWPDALLWVPHHVASVLCCLLAFLFLWRAAETAQGKLFPESKGETRVRWPVLLAGMAFASSLGLSVYVAFGFALLMVAWLVRLLLLRHAERFVWLRRATVAGLLSAAPLAPFLHELAAGSALSASGTARGSTGSPTHFFALSVRPMIDSGLLTGLAVFPAWNRTHPVLLDQAIRLLLLLPGLGMELGLYGAVLVLLLWAKLQTPRQTPPLAPHAAQAASGAPDAALFFTVCGLALTMFLSSSVITNNDFGYRAVMLPQFFLLLLTAEVLGSWGPSPGASAVPLTGGRRRLLGGLLALGIAGSLYWAFLLRAWLPIESHRGQSGFSTSPEDEFQIRKAFRVLHATASVAAVVAFRPIDPTPDRHGQVMMPNEFYQRMLVMDAGRQILNAEGKCAIHFGGDPKACPAIQAATARLYALPAPNAASATEFCSHFGVQYLAVSAWDPDWMAETGWPVTLPAVVREPRFRVLRCR